VAVTIDEQRYGPTTGAVSGWLALTMCVASGLLLLGTPWLLPWYAVWAVPLAAVEEDMAAWIMTLVLCAYLLPDRVPI